MTADESSSEMFDRRYVILFELAVGIIAIILIFAVGRPMPIWSLSAEDSAIGIVATAPLFVLFVAVLRGSWPPFVRLRERVRGTVAEIVRGAPPLSVILIGISAGLGEELFFRGFLQAMITDHFGLPVGLVATSLIFGVLHALTFWYFVLTTLIGLYLGVLFHWTGGLWAPVVCHAVYDIVALLWCQRELFPPPATEPIADDAPL